MSAVLTVYKQIVTWKNQRTKQGNAFVLRGFSNWKKQFNAVKEHAASKAHVDAKVNVALFREEKTLKAIMEKQEININENRKREVNANAEDHRYNSFPWEARALIQMSYRNSGS